MNVSGGNAQMKLGKRKREKEVMKMRRGRTTTRISMQQQKHGEKLNVPAGKTGLQDTHTHTHTHTHTQSRTPGINTHPCALKVVKLRSV